MEILFVRHGESFDDIYREFGSWSNRGLTPAGSGLALNLSNRIRDEFGIPDIILTSPLKRALETAKIIGSELEIRVQEFAYLKERNTYGLLSGVNKDEAIEMYPELNAAFLNGDYIHGAERYTDAKQRVDIMIEEMGKRKEKKVLCITHGHIMTIIIEEHLGLIRNSVQNGSMLFTSMKKGDLIFDRAIDLSFTDEKTIEGGLERVKFKYE